MPCILWVSSDHSSEHIINTIGMTPYKTIEKGETVNTRDGEKHYEQTLCGFDVSKQDFLDLKILVKEATEWLITHYEQLNKLKELKAASKLDFGYYSKFVDSKIVAQYDTIPYQIMKLAGDLHIDIELSQYWYTEDSGAQLN